jgi:hypothetical protein
MTKASSGKWKGKASVGKPKPDPDVTLMEARVLLALHHAEEKGGGWNMRRLLADVGWSPKSGSASWALYPSKTRRGLLAMGYAKAVNIDIDDRKTEPAFEIMEAGEAALKRYIAARGELPPLKSLAERRKLTNLRYKAD